MRARAHKIHCASHACKFEFDWIVHHFPQYCFGCLAAPWLFDLHVLPDCSFRTFANRLFFWPRQHEQTSNLPLVASLPKFGRVRKGCSFSNFKNAVTLLVIKDHDTPLVIKDHDYRSLNRSTQFCTNGGSPYVISP